MTALEELIGVEVARVERIEPWFVWRCHLVGDGATPATVIVKRVRDDPSRGDLRQAATECAALAFLEELGVALAPRCLAKDLDAGVVVLEDLAPRRVLWDLLAADDRSLDAMAGLRSFAGAMGTLSSATHGHDARYYDRRAALGAVDPQKDRLAFLGTPAADLRIGELVGVAATRAAERDWAAVVDLFAEPGPFLALSNGDAGANNYMVDGDDGRLIDFEFAGFRHALLDAHALYMPGSMWMTVADPVDRGVADVHRRALTAAIPAAEDDTRFGRALAAACLAFAVERSQRIPALDQRARPHSSQAQRIVTLETAASVASRQGGFADLRGWCLEVARALRGRWELTELTLSCADGYTTRAGWSP